MKMNKVSIVVPMYNCSNAISRCVHSILAQTYQNIEVLLVDDGSIDDTEIICSEIKKHDDRISIFRQKNSGVSAARNLGIAKAKGRYLMFVDSDDYLSETYVEKMVSALENANAELCISGYTYTYTNEEKKHSCESFLCCDKNEFVKKFGKLYEEYFLHVVWNKIFVRELLKTDFPQGLSLGEDLLFVLEYLKNIQRIAVIEETGYHYVIGQEQSLTAKFRKNGFKIAELLYKSSMNYIEGYNDKDAVEAVCKIFLNDTSKFIKDISINKELDTADKESFLLEIADNQSFRYAIKKWIGTGKRQKLIFSLLKMRWVKLVRKIASV